MPMKRHIKDFILISIGIFSAGFGLKSFLLPNDFIDGGTVGISLLLAETTKIPFSVFFIVVNIPFIVLGLKSMGKEFAIKTALGILALSVVVAFLPYPQLTQDKLLVAVFGGLFLGAGVGFAVRGGGVIDGTEVLAINLSKKFGITIGDIIMIMNIIIFSVAAYLLSIEVALYSILTYLAASKTVDFIIEGIEEHVGVTIISTKSEEIRVMIINKMGRGVTLYKGEKGFGKRGHNNNDINIVYTVLTRLEISKLNAEIDKIDKEAFVVMTSIKDTKGGMIKKRPLNHH
jgi:uncharacterized membrane-anchored protein YitT (DUF2179 family)